MYIFPIQIALVTTDKFRTHLNQYKEEERATPVAARHSKRHLCTSSAIMASITSSSFQVLESINYVKRH